MLLDRHRAKIVPIEQLVGLLGPNARLDGQTVILCHGVFDVVHPGHLRHLLYAKSKADILVCSVTADRHITKGPYRPHVPHDLRAANLALLDIVDYVVVCDEERPLGLLAALRPNYYAKGFEYSAESRNGRPIEEAAVVEGYGGEVLFTPGDVVYSSSTLIEAAAPDLRWDKLAMVMRRADVSFAGMRKVLQSFGVHRVHVVGDTIVDVLLHCEMIGANAKTPTVSVHRSTREEFVGGAAVVAQHARAAGAAVSLTTVLGDDAAGSMVLDRLREVDVEVCPVVDRARPTTVKEAVVVGGYRLLKIDTVDNRSVSDAVLRHICEQVADTRDGAVVLSDFRHGIFNSRTIPSIAAAIPTGCLRAADSQVASRWGNITDFVGFDLITPNEREARFALADQDSGVRSLAARLHKEARCRWLLMKLGARGVLGEEADSGAAFALDAFAERVVDPVGAGDAFLAYAAAALLVKPCLATAAILGSFAAGIECGYDGNVPVAPEYVLSKIDEAEREVGQC